MHIISRSKLIDFWKKHPPAETGLKTWFQKVQKAKWNSLQDIKKDFPTADLIGNDRVIFDIKGNDYRMICLVFIKGQKVYIRFIGTHSAYDKIKDAKKI
jgi:mRNA interferase HigB